MSGLEERTEISKANLVESIGNIEENKAHEEQPVKKHEEKGPSASTEHIPNLEPEKKTSEDVQKKRSSSSSSSASLPLAENPPLQDRVAGAENQNKNYKQKFMDYYSRAKDIALEKKVQVGVLAATVGGVIAITALRKLRKRG